ncbi:MAG TPA: glycosyltransferase family 2 protein, partial [Acidobacteriota bacterium]|nr:glycosyltransferase family 2 protein [Acidobacteriota bacterium]
MHSFGSDILFWTAAALAAGTVVVLVQLAMARYSTRRLSDIDPVEESRAPSVAIIVPARNEERHLESALSSLLKLDYPDYQVV